MRNILIRILQALVIVAVASSLAQADDFMFFRKKQAAGGAPACNGTQNFVGAPGATEEFDAGSGGFCTSAFSETDTEGTISFSASAKHAGTYGALFANGSSADYTNYLKADLGTTEASFSLTWWMYVGADPGIYNNYPMFRSRLDDVPNGTGSNDSSMIYFNNNGGTFGIILYSIYGGDPHLSSATYAYGAWYKLVLKRTNNTVNGMTLDLYNAAESLLETLTADASNTSTQYMYWFDQMSGNNFYVDSIIFNTTDP